MAHASENSIRLEPECVRLESCDELRHLAKDGPPGVHLLWLPAGRTDEDAARSQQVFGVLRDYCGSLHQQATICILTTPADAARLLPYLDAPLRFQLWVAVNLKAGTYPESAGHLPNRHAALLVLTRYRGSLKHTRTRIEYTYCPACGKTTKDYGGKKHIYHEYGTLMSDVWRDIECDPRDDIRPIVDRLRDLFGLDPYRKLLVLDLRSCRELGPAREAESQPTQRIRAKSRPLSLPSRLIHGDCIEALQSIPDNSVDFCFADPPYNLQKKYDHWNDTLETREYFAWCDGWLTELARVLRPGRTLAVINIPLWAVRHYEHLCTALNFQDWIAWEALGFPVRLIMPAHYAIICFSKGHPKPLPRLPEQATYTVDTDPLRPLAEFFCLRTSCIYARRKRRIPDTEGLSDLWYDIHRLKHNSRRVDHPCQLPPLLMSRIFALYTQPGELILDCFNGAGTSTLIAEQMGRGFIGIEISEKYHKIAESRHQLLREGRDPFAKDDTVPEAKNSRVARLPKQDYAISKKALQLEVRRIAKELGRLPAREEVKARARYPIEYYDRYFISWGEVCAAARNTGMSELPPEKRSQQLPLLLSEKSRRYRVVRRSR